MFGQASKVSATMLAQGLTGLGGIALAAALGRVGGPEVLGMFTIMLSLLGVLGMLARRGQSSLLMRAVAWALHTDGRGAALTLLALAVRRVLIPSLVTGAVGSALLWSGVFRTPYPGSVVALPIALLLVTILSVFAGYARGCARPWLAPVFEMGGVSLVTVAILSALLAVWGKPSAEDVLVVFLLAIVLLTGLAMVLAYRDRPQDADLFQPSQDQRDELSRGQIAFTLIAFSSFLVQSGSFLLAAPVLSATDLGLLRAAERLALLVSFPMLAIRPVIGPRMVRLARNGDGTKLRRGTLLAMLASGGTALPFLLVLFVWPERALDFIGTEFAAAVPYVRIMALAQFVVAVLGPLVGLLHMTGRERVSMWINLGMLALATVLVPSFSVAYGAPGFALTYAAIITMRVAMIAVTVLLTAPMLFNKKRSLK